MASLPPVYNSTPREPGDEQHFDRLETWVGAIHYSTTLFNWIVEGRLSFLPGKDQQYFLRLLERCALFHLRVTHNELLVLGKLKEYGYNLNCLNDSGRSFLTYVNDSNLYHELKQLGAEYIHPKKNELSYLLDRFRRNLGQTLVRNFLKTATVEDLLQLDSSCAPELFALVERDKEIEASFKELLIQMQKEDCNLAAKFILRTLRGDKSKILVDKLMLLITLKVIKSPTIEILFGEVELFKAISGMPEEQLTILKRSGPYSILFHALLSINDTVKNALWCLSILKCSHVKELAAVLVSSPTALMSIHRTIKQFCLAHIIAIQNRDHDSVWMHFDNLNALFFEHLITFGIDPRTQNSLGRNFLFTPWVASIPVNDLKTIFTSPIKDRFNNNPLDYFILNPIDKFSDYVTIIQNLISLGYRVSAHIPHYELCIKSYPVSPFYFALMAYYLNSTQKFKVAAENLRSTLEGSYILDKLKELPEFLCRIEFLKSSRGSPDGWEKLYPPEIAQGLKLNVNLTYGQLKFLPTLFKGVFPDNFLTAVPNSLEASLFRLIFPRIDPGETEIFHELIVRLLKTRESILQLFHHFFKNPVLYKLFMERMKVTELQLYVGGQTCGPFIHDLRTLLGNLGCSYWVGSFPNHVDEPSVEMNETFSIPNKASVNVQGYTLVISGERQSEVRIFLQKGRTYIPFRTECLAMQRLISAPRNCCSFLPASMNLRIYNSLPSRIPSNFRSKLGAGPFIAHHFFVDNMGPRVPLLTLAEGKLAEATVKWEKDYVHQVMQNEVPQLIPIEQSGRRKRVILHELWCQLNSRRKTASHSSFIPAPYESMDTLEINSEGLSHPTHIYRKSPIQKEDGDFFNSMEALAKGIEVDLVVWLCRLKEKGIRIQWDNQDLVQELADHLFKAFARFSSYNNKPESETSGFIKECGIDWQTMAAQILFWGDTTPNGYIAWLEKGMLPNAIFDPSIRIVIDFKSFSQYINKTKNCFEVNGSECFGIPFGPSGWVDFHKAVHLLFLSAVILPEPETSQSASGKSRRGLTMTYPSYGL